MDKEKITLDVRGQDCPIPLNVLKNELAKANQGQAIEVDFTCPEATVNIPRYCQENGIEILDYEKEGNKFWRITVRK